MVFQAFLDGLHIFASAQTWLLIWIGIFIGLLFGIIPGIGTIMAVTLCLPFLWSLGPEQALPLLMAIFATVPTGGSITSVLVGVPGTVVNAATLLDGFPMTRKGQGARAVGAALTASGVAGVLGVAFSIALVPLILPMIFAIDSADTVFLIIMGLGFIAVMSKGSSAIKGLIAGGFGMLMSFVGAHIITAEYRFTFGTQYLVGGIPVVCFALGLFAAPEIFAMATSKDVSAKVDKAALGLAAVLQGSKDVFRHWLLVIRCTLIGWVIGIIPGVGGSSAIWIAYGHARQTSKHPEKFGTGVVEGVIAPECANNAEVGGALLTTLALGIPGSAPMVLMLAALEILNVRPGPEMMTTHLALSLTTLDVGLIANILGAVVCILLGPYIIKFANVPSRIMVPLVTIVILIGAFANNGVFLDMVTVLVLSALGLAMKKYGFNRPAMVLGFVMGDLFEKYLSIAIDTKGVMLFFKPTTMVIIALTIILFSYEPIMNKIRSRRARGV